MTTSTDILDLARWAPSGDNTQPWRFAVDGSDSMVTVFGFDTRNHCVYDLDGHPSQLSLGALLETIALAATRFGRVARIARRNDSNDEHPIFDIALESRSGLAEDPLVRYIAERRVQRRPLRMRKLSGAEKASLERAVGPDVEIRWFERLQDRARIARLNFRNAKLRLTLPEAYPVHRDTIDWNAEFSEDRIPAAAIGASAPSLKVMRWAMRSWERVAFLNRYAAGTVAPRLELDLVPGIACGAHAVFIARQPARSIDDYVAAGRVIQRFWLTATALGLQFQPEYTPLVFARYVREQTPFTRDARGNRQARRIHADLSALLGPATLERTVFIGRIGAGEPAAARSTRHSLAHLMQPQKQ